MLPDLVTACGRGGATGGVAYRGMACLNLLPLSSVVGCIHRVSGSGEWICGLWFVGCGLWDLQSIGLQGVCHQASG